MYEAEKLNLVRKF